MNASTTVLIIGVSLLIIVFAGQYIAMITSKPQEIGLLIHERINNERIKAGLQPLQYDTKLAEIAEAHSKDMAKKGYFSHKSPVGLGPADRANLTNYPCALGENITTIYTWLYKEQLAQHAVNNWMFSDAHRENILSTTYEKEGIGIAFTFISVAYVTQNFC
ncbi:MAG: CAP domain-containing protein [Nitrososphaeraceae archaeon]